MDIVKPKGLFVWKEKLEEKRREEKNGGKEGVFYCLVGWGGKIGEKTSGAESFLSRPKIYFSTQIGGKT
jgi:hypothetical protein